MTVAIIDYGSGNLRSAAKAFERAVAEAGMKDTDDAETVRRADRVVLPGVGAFADCKHGLEAVPGMMEAIDEAVIDRGRPFLGICVGMQLMAEVGREHGEHAGFGWLPAEIVQIAPSDPSLKIPHMGWNELRISNGGHPVFAGIAEGAHAYFVHSYAARCRDADHLLATVEYGGDITAAVGRDNLVGTQFHPEKSQHTGLSLITNFLKWKP